MFSKRFKATAYAKRVHKVFLGFSCKPNVLGFGYVFYSFGYKNV